MKTFEKIFESLKNSFSSFGTAIVEYLPTLVSAIVVLLIGWILSKTLAKALGKGLDKIGINAMSEKVGLDKMIKRMSQKMTLSILLSKVVYYVLMLFFFTATVDLLGIEMLKQGLASLMGYLPTLAIAIIIFVMGIFIAQFIKNMIYSAANSIGVSGAKAIANIVYYLLFIFIAITALNQAGINTEIITSNLTIIMGGMLLAFAISYGYASRGLVTNILSSYYGKGKFFEGQKLRIGKVEGTVEKIDSISVTLNCGDKTVVIPSKDLVEKRIEILN